MTADESMNIFPPYFSLRWFFKDFDDKDPMK